MEEGVRAGWFGGGCRQLLCGRIDWRLGGWAFGRDPTATAAGHYRLASTYPAHLPKVDQGHDRRLDHRAEHGEGNHLEKTGQAGEHDYDEEAHPGVGHGGARADVLLFLLGGGWLYGWVSACVFLSSSL